MLCLDVIRRHGISFHGYAANIQLHIPEDMNPVKSLYDCILDM